jgi:Flp pilus assembly protein TadD
VARQPADDGGLDDDEAVGLAGDAPEGVIEYSRVVDAADIVVSGRKRSAVGQAVSGSFTRTLLVETDRPVVAAPRPTPALPEWTDGRPGWRRRPEPATLTRRHGQSSCMTDEEPDDAHEFSEGQGFGEPYEGFDIDPPSLDVDPDQVDPVDSRVVADTLDREQIPADRVDAEELLDVGLDYLRINRHEQATDTFERAARYTDREAVAQEAWVNKGAAHAELQEFERAIDAYREALRIDGESDTAASAETNLAYALYEAGRSEQALEHAERAVELDPRFPQGWYNRGFFLLQRGLPEDAVSCFDNALRLGHRSPDVLEEKARALEELGEEDRAEELASEAEELRQQAEERMVEERKR